MDKCSSTIRVVDQLGIQKQTIELVVPKLQLTARELIRLRVHDEFTNEKLFYENASEQVKEIRKGLIGKTEKQFVWMDSIGKIDLYSSWETEAEKACINFQNGKFIIIAAGRQLVDLDEKFILDPAGIVKFIKLIPMVGG